MSWMMNPAAGWKAAALAGCLVLGGCATQQPLYYWGGYPQQVYRDLSEEGSLDERIASMETIQGEAQARTAALPPGFRGHLGLLYAQAGRQDAAQAQWVEEKTYFPESGHFMDFLLRGGREAAPQSPSANTTATITPVSVPTASAASANLRQAQ